MWERDSSATESRTLSYIYRDTTKFKFGGSRMEVEGVEPMQLGRSNKDLDQESNALLMKEMLSICTSWVYPAALRAVLDLQVVRERERD